MPSTTTFLENCNQFYWVHDLTGRILESAVSTSRLIGYTREQLLGQNPYDYFHPDDKEYIQKEGHEPALQGRSVSIEYRFKKATGEYVWLRTEAFMLPANTQRPERIFSISTPIDDIVTYRNTVHRQNEIFEHAGTMAKIGGWEFDLEDNSLSWSKMTYEIHEVDESFKPTLENALDFFPEKYKKILQDHVKTAVDQGIPYDVVVQFKTAKGRLIWVRAIGQPQLLYGKVVKLHGVFQDVNEEYEQQRSLNELVSRLSAQKKQLLDFNQIVSHNLRAPVANLRMLLDLTEREKDPDEKELLLQNIRSISNSLNTLLDQLVDVVKISTRTNEDIQVLDIKDVINDTLSLVQGDVKNLNAKVETDLEWREVSYSKLHMESIFLNMFTNSLKYASNARPPVITVITKEIDGYKKLIFKDNGSGIDLARNGHKVFKLNQIFHKDRPGKGLGLFMTKNQIEAAGGAIEIESEIEKGTQFTITIN